MPVYELWLGERTGKTFYVIREVDEEPKKPKSPYDPDEPVTKLSEEVVE